MSRTHAVVVGVVFAVLAGCTSGSSTSFDPQPSGISPSAPPAVFCQENWKYSPVPGSDSTMVPGDPAIALSCDGTDRSVMQGSQLTTLVTVLNRLPLLEPSPCINGISGPVPGNRQFYFTYPSGEVQLVNLSQSCGTVSNGALTAKLTQALKGSLYGPN
jgi:hypothetical protein